MPETHCHGNHREIICIVSAGVTPLPASHNYKLHGLDALLSKVFFFPTGSNLQWEPEAKYIHCFFILHYLKSRRLVIPEKPRWFLGTCSSLPGPLGFKVGSFAFFPHRIHPVAFCTNIDVWLVQRPMSEVPQFICMFPKNCFVCLEHATYKFHLSTPSCCPARRNKKFFLSLLPHTH